MRTTGNRYCNLFVATSFIVGSSVSLSGCYRADSDAFTVEQDINSAHVESLEPAGMVGIGFAPNDKSELEVVNIKVNSSASMAGIHLGDRITAVGGRAVENMKPGEVGALMRGELGTEVVISVQNEHGEITDIALERR